MLLGVTCVLLRAWVVGSQGLAVESGVINAGAVLSTVGNTAPMQQARQGYEYFVEVANSQNDGRGLLIKGRDGAELFFRFNFTWLNDYGQEARHVRQVKQLLERDRVHFLFGSHPRFAMGEAELANRSGIINYHCCVGLDTVYERGFEYVFGIQVSNRKYGELVVRAMNLKGLKRLAMVYYQPDEFTRTTCEAALQIVEEFQQTIDKHPLEVVLHENYDNMTEGMQKKWFARFAREAKKQGVEAVVGCSLFHDGEELVRAFHELR